ncbi:hypothetical protein JW835_03855 [bacterium]|nr:hypothetical protein [bacterium]RQV97931.1 MAG: hypothetical protein EH221_02955 [bacterium]
MSDNVVNTDHICFSMPLTGQILIGNKFWDKKQENKNKPPVVDPGGAYSYHFTEPMILDNFGYYDPDRYTVIWNEMDKNNQKVSTGIYLFHIQAGSFRKTVKIMNIK